MFLRCQEFTQAKRKSSAALLWFNYLRPDFLVFRFTHIHFLCILWEISLKRLFFNKARIFFLKKYLYGWFFFWDFFFREEIWIIQNQTNAQIEDQLFFPKPTAPKAASWLVCSLLTEEFSLAFSIAMLRSWQTYENVSSSTSKNLLQSSREIWPNSEGHF